MKVDEKSSKMREVEVCIGGRVQGVNFRNDVRKFCSGIGVKGFVENKEDGSVEIIAQGDEKVLEDFLDWLRKSPGFSKVERMSYNFRDVGKEYPDFRVLSRGSFVFDKAKSLVNLAKYLVEGERVVVPQHVAIIPDGNRRWARNRGFEESLGHYKSGNYDSLEELFREAKRLGVKYVSIWGFSSENWSRSLGERNAIFDLVLSDVERFQKSVHEKKIRFRHIGRRDRLPRKLVRALEKLEKETESYGDFNVQLFLDYGGRDEIVRAVNRILKGGIKEVGEGDFGDYLDTAGIPDVDLIVRTSGEKRTSGLMPFQGVYSELYFSDKHFPDFKAGDLRRAVEEFGKRQRRFGG